MKKPRSVFEFICLCCDKKSEVVSLAAVQASEHICHDCKDLKEHEYLMALSISRGTIFKKRKSRQQMNLWLCLLIDQPETDLLKGDSMLKMYFDGLSAILWLITLCFGIYCYWVGINSLFFCDYMKSIAWMVVAIGITMQYSRRSSNHVVIAAPTPEQEQEQSAMSLAQLFKSEVNAKTRLIHQSNPKMTRRASPGHLNSGYTRDSKAQYQINLRMYSRKDLYE